MTAVSSDADLRTRIVESMYDLLPQVLRREVPTPTEQTRLMEDLGLTSSTTLELLLELEEKLEIQINVEEIDQQDVGTIGALADYIAGHLLTDE
jgi:acyl carrier protein